MKSFLLKISACSVILLVLGISSIFAQNDEAVLVSVDYQFVHVYDTNNSVSPIVADMLLQVGKTNSKYCNVLFNNEYKPASGSISISSVRTGTGESPAVMRFSGMPMAVVYDRSIIPGAIYQSFVKKKIIRTQKIGVKDFLTEDPLPKIDWKIENETKEIASYTCQKAKGVYAGRTYIAWFASALPYTYGPWKLSGLPGLILEAKDATGEVQFLFKEISAEKGEMAVFTATRPIKITTEQLLKAEREFKLDPVGTVSAQVQFSFPPGSTPYYKDASGKILSGDAAKTALQQEAATRYNNPIERL